VKVFSLENGLLLRSEPKCLRSLKAATMPSLQVRWRILHRGGGLVHGMLSKGFVRNLGEPVLSSDKGVLITEETRLEDEGQVVGSTHSTVEAG